MRKCFILSALVLAALLAGCAASPAASQTPQLAAIEDNPLFEDIYTSVGSFSVNRYVYDDVNGETEEELYVTEDPAEIRELIAMFNGWDPEEHYTDDVRLCIKDYIIRFGDALAIQRTSSCGSDLYAEIVGIFGSYDLPDAFVEHLHTLIIEAEGPAEDVT